MTEMPLSGIALYILRGAFYFYAPHHHFSFLISNFSFLIQAKLSHAFKERHAPQADLEIFLFFLL